MERAMKAWLFLGNLRFEFQASKNYKVSTDTTIVPLVPMVTNVLISDSTLNSSCTIDEGVGRGSETGTLQSQGQMAQWQYLAPEA